MYFLLSISGIKNDMFIYWLLYSSNMTDSVRALREIDYDVNKAVTGRAKKLQIIDGALVVDGNYHPSHDVKRFGDAVDIFTLAARANQNYTDLKSEIEERQKKTNYPLSYPRGFDPYQQKSEISDDYKDPYKKLGVV
jgi:hypothetical protein